MTPRAQELLREALALPVDQRADVAAELLASLDEAARSDQAAVKAAWAREIGGVRDASSRVSRPGSRGGMFVPDCSGG